MTDFTDILDITPDPGPPSPETLAYEDVPLQELLVSSVYSDGSPSSGPVTPAFQVVAFQPLNNGLVQASDTSIILDMSLSSGTLNTSEVTVQISGATIFTGGVFSGEYTTSSIVAQGGGIFRYTIVKDTPWAGGSSVEVRVFPPGETP